MSKSQSSAPRLPSKLILTSTKAYFTPSRTVEYLTSILDPATGILPLLESHRSELLFVLIPDFLTIYPCSQILSSRYPSASTSPPQDTNSDSDTNVDSTAWPLALGAQNAFQTPSSTPYGAYTGEITPAAIKSLGCAVVELNHAERRRLLGESDETAALKTGAVTRAGLVPLVCIGELARPDLDGPLSAAVGVAVRELTPQIECVLGAVEGDAQVVIFAYEPVWAIGAAEPAGVEYVGPVVQAIREMAREVGLRSGKGGVEVKVVYGGSAGPGLWSGRANGGNGLGKYVDGLFLGRFAHKVDGVRGVVEEVVESLKGA
ncbi:hypothetical protein LTR84_006901 [Exophiala bonariae]|uniref:Triosephosphate isomerase n=1 Tax=Exophiala bonariae TaxID=1690606 RepID=A0AAV9N075_9EURO|nr:hypothetical protein LTR84_006901 [Exophiala bonariae]